MIENRAVCVRVAVLVALVAPSPLVGCGPSSNAGPAAPSRGGSSSGSSRVGDSGLPAGAAGGGSEGGTATASCDFASYALGRATSPPDCSPDVANFVGTQPWGGTENVDVNCTNPDAGNYLCTNNTCRKLSVSGIVIRATDVDGGGITLTDPGSGCTLNLTIGCNDVATLPAPQSCAVSTDAGVVNEQFSQARLGSDGHQLSGTIGGAANLNSHDCSLSLGISLTR